MSVLGMIVSDFALLLPCTVYPKLECGILSDRCSLQRGRDEAVRHFCRVILFRSVQPRFHPIVAEDNHIPVLGLGGLTFLQLTTTYSPVLAGRNIGHVSSGRTNAMLGLNAFD